MQKEVKKKPFIRRKNNLACGIIHHTQLFFLFDEIHQFLQLRTHFDKKIRDFSL